jgi:hypothetical protein
MQIKINRTVLIALSLIAARDETRHVLQGVCIQVTPPTKTKPAKCYVVATDGRRLCAAEAGTVVVPPEKKCDAIIRVKVPMLKALPKSKDQSQDILITFTEKTATFAPNRIDSGVSDSFTSELIQGNYPKWRQVIPKGEQPAPIDPLFNWRLLEGFIKVAEMLQPKNSGGVRLRQADPLAPILILIPNVPWMVGVLMPLRDKGTRTCAPDWAIEQPERQLKTEPEAPATPAPVAA